MANKEDEKKDDEKKDDEKKYVYIYIYIIISKYMVNIDFINENMDNCQVLFKYQVKTNLFLLGAWRDGSNGVLVLVRGP
jgi:hypothetical protein